MMDADRIVEQYLRQRQSPALREPDGLRPPRGIRNCNPGNIRDGAEKWAGQTGADAGGMCTFESAHYGLRALAKLLLTYHDRYGLSTVRSIISRWAPPSENDTGAYIDSVCGQTSFGPDAWLRVGDPSVLSALVRAIVRQENGAQPYDDAEIGAAVEDALS